MPSRLYQKSNALLASITHVVFLSNVKKTELVLHRLHKVHRAQRPRQEGPGLEGLKRPIAELACLGHRRMP